MALSTSVCHKYTRRSHLSGFGAGGVWWMDGVVFVWEAWPYQPFPVPHREQSSEVHTQHPAEPHQWAPAGALPPRNTQLDQICGSPSFAYSPFRVHRDDDCCSDIAYTHLGPRSSVQCIMTATSCRHNIKICISVTGNIRNISNVF